MRQTDYPAVGETLYSSVLPNGLPVFVIPKPGYRRNFAIFAANYGGADRRFLLDGTEHLTPAGVAHYLEHKMFDTPEGDALMRLNAAGADPNAFTSEAMTAYHFECVDNFGENLRTLLSFVSVPYFTQASVDKERGIIGQEIRMYEDNPDFAVYVNLMKGLFPEGCISRGSHRLSETVQRFPVSRGRPAILRSFLVERQGFVQVSACQNGADTGKVQVIRLPSVRLHEGAVSPEGILIFSRPHLGIPQVAEDIQLHSVRLRGAVIGHCMTERLLRRLPVSRCHGFDPGIPVLPDLFHPLSAAGQKEDQEHKKQQTADCSSVPFIRFPAVHNHSLQIKYVQLIPVLPKPPRSFPPR